MRQPNRYSATIEYTIEVMLYHRDRLNQQNRQLGTPETDTVRVYLQRAHAAVGNISMMFIDVFVFGGGRGEKLR